MIPINNTALYAFRKYGDTVLRAAYSCCGCYEEAEDITQDVFLQLHTQPVEFNDDEHMKAWLLRVTMNKCKNFKRSFRRSRTDAIDETTAIPSVTMDTTDIEVRELISKLPQKYAIVVFLHFFEEYTVKEIAEILGKKPNTVNSLLQRGKDKLRTILTDTLNDTPTEKEEAAL